MIDYRINVVKLLLIYRRLSIIKYVQQKIIDCTFDRRSMQSSFQISFDNIIYFIQGDLPQSITNIINSYNKGPMVIHKICAEFYDIFIPLHLIRISQAFTFFLKHVESSICDRAMPFAVKPKTIMPNSNSLQAKRNDIYGVLFFRINKISLPFTSL